MMRRKPISRIGLIKKWAKDNPKKFWLIVSAAILLISVVSVYAYNAQSSSKSSSKLSSKSKATAEKKKYFSTLTGAESFDPEASKMPVTGVMIENSTNSRPQSGLKNSGVIFEAIAEGGITRFLVLYQLEKPQTIGPVRSLRLYDIDWLVAFDGSIAHVGGSANALQEIRNGQHRDLDQFFNSAYYWRATDRYAPHNVYTSFEKLDALSSSKGYNSSNFEGFKRIDGKPIKTPDATKIDITVSGPLYNSSYTYDKSTNTYARYQAGAPHLDREDGQITPSVVIALKVDQETVLEDGYRESIVTIGSGDAVIFQNGTAINARWHKATTKSQISFSDEEGNEISLARGQTWITAVPNGSGDVQWQ